MPLSEDAYLPAPSAQQFRARLRARLSEDQISVREAAKRAGVNYIYLHRVLAGSRDCTKDCAARTVKALAKTSLKAFLSQ
jgi:predicted transcriptional regulator